MKRSKIVDLLVEYNRYHYGNGPLAHLSELEFADYLLEKLEEQGMRPPRLPEEDCQAIMNVYYAGYSLNQWEEDFVKDEKVQKAKQRRADAAVRRAEKSAARKLLKQEKE